MTPIDVTLRLYLDPFSDPIFQELRFSSLASPSAVNTGYLCVYLLASLAFICCRFSYKRNQFECRILISV